jgi:hypothetical protein
MSCRMVRRIKLAVAMSAAGVAFGPLTCVRTGDGGVIVPAVVTLGALGAAAQAVEELADPGGEANAPFAPIAQHDTGG